MTAGTSLSRSRLLVTGGGSGIGRQIALGAAHAGAEVVIWDLDAARGAAVREEILRTGGAAEAAVVDVTDRAAVTEAAAAAGPVDILVNNAGVVTGARLHDASPEEIERTFAVNTLSLFWVTRAFLDGMVARDRGTVVTVASAAGLVGVARQTDYSASKFAAVGFTESLRAELRRDGSGVRTLTVCPYYVDTGMFEGVRTRVPLLLPILREADVAAKILRAVERGSAQLVLPPAARLLPPLRALPVKAFDAVMDLLGINETMTHFTGRAGDAQRQPQTTSGRGAAARRR